MSQPWNRTASAPADAGTARGWRAVPHHDRRERYEDRRLLSEAGSITGSSGDLLPWATELADPAVVVYEMCMKRTNVVVDTRLLARARKLTGVRTTREILARALEELVTREEQRRLAVRLRGSGWNGSLTEMRNAR